MTPAEAWYGASMWPGLGADDGQAGDGKPTHTHEWALSALESVDVFL